MENSNTTERLPESPTERRLQRLHAERAAFRRQAALGAGTQHGDRAPTGAIGAANRETIGANNSAHTKRGNEATATSQHLAKKQKKEKKKKYVYPVFESFAGWKYPDYEGGREECSTTLVAVMTKQSNAEKLCIEGNMKAYEEKKALEGEVPKFEKFFEFKKTALDTMGSQSLFESDGEGIMMWSQFS